jgi:hypothetical protein
MGQTTTLTGLGQSFHAEALSRNGQVVVGTDTSAEQAAYWSGGIVTDIGGPGVGATAYSCNADGSVIVGETAEGLPFIWEKQGTSGVMQMLPLLASSIHGAAARISANGATIAGECDGQPVIWTLAGVFALPDAMTSTTLLALSDDGSTLTADLIGDYTTSASNILEAATGALREQFPVIYSISSLGLNTTDVALNPYNPDSGVALNELAYEDIFCLTSDGSVGFGGNYNLYFTVDTIAKTILPESSGFWAVSANLSGSANIWNLKNFEIHSCNQDGTVLAGQVVTELDGVDQNNLPEIVSINPGNAMIAFNGGSQDLKKFLTGLGAATTGWMLFNVGIQSMSADGTVILGTGLDPSNKPEQWLAVITPSLSKLAPTQSSVVGGTSLGATLSVNYPVGAATTATITTNNTTAVPDSSATLSQGSMSTGFTLNTNSVSTATAVVITAHLGSSTASASVTINPNPLSNFYFTQSTITGGSSTTGHLEIQGPAGPAGNVISLSFPSGSDGLSAATTEKIAAGGSSTTFTLSSAAVSATASVPIKATFNGKSLTVILTVTPYSITAFNLSAATAVGGNAVSGTITLAGKAGPSGDLVSLKSSGSGVTVPATATVAAAATAVTFAVSSTPVTVVATVTLTATLGSSTVSTIIKVVPAIVSVVRVAPSPVVGGVSTKCAVYINGAAPTGGQAVAVSCNSTFATFPASITVPAGATAANATVTTSPVSVPTTVVVTGKTAAVSAETTFVINPAPLASIKTATSTVVGGKATVLTITLGGKAGPTGLVVQLGSSSADIVVPATVTVPAGATTTTVNLTTLAVKANTSVTLTATTATSSTTFVVTLTT